MATESPSAGDTFRVFHEKEWHELIVRSRFNVKLSAEILAQLTLKTIGVWLRTWQAYKTEKWAMEGDSPEKMLQVDSTGLEPFVTVFNKNFTGMSITVHSSDNGQGALNAVMALIFARDDIADKMPKLFNPDSATPPAKPAPKKDINNVDDFIPPHPLNPPQAPSEGFSHPLNFRYFKRLAPNVIQLQEYVQGGGGKDKYQKSAIEANLPYHKTNTQYDAGALVYFPVTGAIQLKNGQYGKQAIIPTSRGRVYVDAQFNGQEKPEWASLSSDLGDDFFLLNDNENAVLEASGAVLVLKMSDITTNKQGVQVQYKNFYRLYQELKA